MQLNLAEPAGVRALIDSTRRESETQLQRRGARGGRGGRPRTGSPRWAYRAGISVDSSSSSSSRVRMGSDSHPARSFSAWRPERKTPLPQHPSWLVSSDPINCGGSGAGMEFLAFPAWELSVDEGGSDLETFSQEKKKRKKKEPHAG